MPDLRTFEEFEHYANSLGFRDLERILLSLDRDKYPERYALVFRLIQEKAQESKGLSSLQEMPDESPVETHLSMLVDTYYTFVSLGVLVFVLPLFLTGGLLVHWIDCGVVLVSVLAYLIGRLSISRRWALLPIITISYIGVGIALVFALLPLAHGMQDIALHYVGTIILGLFCGYQLFVYTRPGIRDYIAKS